MQNIIQNYKITDNPLPEHTFANNPKGKGQKKARYVKRDTDAVLYDLVQ